MSDNEPVDVGPDEFPFYSNEAKEAIRLVEKYTYGPDAETLATYRLSRASAPSPNTLVPLRANGLFPDSTIPVPTTTIAGIIYSRDGLKQYQLFVEADGALSLDPL